MYRLATVFGLTSAQPTPQGLSGAPNFKEVRSHIIENCQLLNNTTSVRKIELGQIVFEKICERLRKDIQLYVDSMN